MHPRHRHLALLCTALFALPAAAHAESTGGTPYPDATVAQDGSLLVTDDGSNSIWRISYSGK